MKQPCDEAIIQAGASDHGCRPESQPWVLAATILGSSMAFIDGTVVNVALPALQSSLHATVVDVQWVIESYGLFLSALIMVGGSLGDVVGRRLMFLLGVGMFAGASIACGLSSSVAQLVIARSVQGIGAAALVPSSLAIISASFDEKARGKAIGTWAGFTAITTAVGPVLGGWLVEHASWHWVFFINVPLAAVVIALSMWHVPESRAAGARSVDWLGAVIETAGLAGVVYAFIESAILGWRHPVVLGSLIAGIALLVVFVAVEMRVAAPMVPMWLFKTRSFSGANLLTLLLYAALGIFMFLYPLNMIQERGYSPTAAGAAALPTILLVFFLSRWSGGLVASYGPRLPLIAGPIIICCGFLLFAFTRTGTNYWTTFFPGFMVLGFGLAVTVAPLTTVVMSSVEPNRVGTASGINNAVSRMAGVLAVAVIGLLMVEAFGHRLQLLLASVSLAPDVLNEIQSNVIKLGGLEVPANLDAESSARVRGALTEAFAYGYRLAMLLCAGLVAASAAVAARMISSKKASLIVTASSVTNPTTIPAQLDS